MPASEGSLGADPPQAREGTVLVPGWSHGRHAFDALRASMGPDRHVVAVDPPGMGDNQPDRCGVRLDAIADTLYERAPRIAVWVGWSLGGLTALTAAQLRPERVARVVLLASTPRFTAAPGWPGMEPERLAQFIDLVEADPAMARDRFLGLQVAPGQGQRRALAALRRCAERDGAPPVATLRAGLELLRDTDLRDSVAALPCPVDAILAEADPLVPVAVAPALQALGVRVWVLSGLGHAPWLHAPDQVAATLEEIELERSPGPAR